MPAQTVRITPKGHRLLAKLAAELNRSMPQILDEALEAYRRQRFLEAANADLALLKANKKAWKAYRDELAAIDSTVADGLPRE